MDSRNRVHILLLLILAQLQWAEWQQDFKDSGTGAIAIRIKEKI